MIPDSDFIRVSFFLTQRLLKASSGPSPRCHSIWRNARFLIDQICGLPRLLEQISLYAPQGSSPYEILAF
ncbi:MAG: hypothetical protein HC767_05085 [Akkermansiaceae bacterium]|nr:hypothetical protein [Akkermansiaceae bacterium]